MVMASVTGMATRTDENEDGDENEDHGESNRIPD